MIRAGLPATAVVSDENILDDHGVGTDLGAGTNRDQPENLRPGTHYDAVLQRRMALPLGPGSTAQRHAMIERHIVADHRRFRNHHAHAMIDEEPAAIVAPWRDRSQCRSEDARCVK